MMNFARALRAESMIRYLAWKAASRADPVKLTFRGGATVLLRADKTENNDYGVAYEVFVHELYKLPASIDPSRVRRVVDIGGNVGFSVLHWLNLFPDCTVETFEPNPRHVAQMRRNLEASGKSDRVTVHAAAAGASVRRLRFSDKGTSSMAVADAEDGFDADMIDVFPILAAAPIDVLKLDLEGGEYELLDDARFGRLDIGCVVMEWHSRGGGDADRLWCEERLRALGYRIAPLFTEADHGMFWALRPNGRRQAA